MDRRHLLKGSALLAAAASANTGLLQAQVPAAGSGREYYLIRRYKLSSGPQGTAAGKYFQDALLPALGRLGFGPVGVMALTYGSETPTTFVLIPSTDLTRLVQLDLLLAQDEAFQKAAGAFWSVTAPLPPFDRVNSSLSIAFEGFPKLIALAKEPRILQLRTYESPTYAAHVRKVEMFHKGEFDFFAQAGAKNVFFSDNLIGAALDRRRVDLRRPRPDNLERVHGGDVLPRAMPGTASARRSTPSSRSPRPAIASRRPPACRPT